MRNNNLTEHNIPDPTYVRIFDTTLRDGEQSPGAAMTPTARLRVAKALAAAGADIIEAGFPAASPLVLQSVAQIARNVRGSSVAALARCIPGDIDKAWEALQRAESPRIHTFLATSDIHLEHKLRMTRKQATETAKACVAQARAYCADVEFSAEDATRSDPEFLAEIFSAAVAAGASTLNVPDTVGYTTPEEMFDLITYLMENTKGIEHAVISVHTHDDLGMATANALAAVRAGARQVEVAVNGIGERAGNCALEEIVMALRTRGDFFEKMTRFRPAHIRELSSLVSRSTRMPVQKNKAIVGANAFAHQSGIHQDGVLKNRETYEIIDPTLVGAISELPLGRNSGRAALRDRMKRLGFDFDETQRQTFEAAFREFAEHKPTVTDSDLRKLANRVHR